MKIRGRRHAHAARAVPRATGPARRVELLVDRLGAGGDGIGEGPMGRVYVAGALPGERITVDVGPRRGDGWRGSLVGVLTPAPERIAPPCRHFGVCGGCALQHLADAPYRDFKRARIAQALARRGFDGVAIEGPARPLPGGRRRASFAARRTSADVILGFNEAGSDRIVSLAECPVLAPEITTLLPPLRALLKQVAAPGGTLDVSVTLAASGLDLLFIGLSALDLTAREAFADFAETHDLARISAADGPREPTEPLVARRPVVVRFAGPGAPVTVTLPPRAFLQATAEGEAAIVAAVLALLPKGRRAADLFAGCGSLSFALLDRVDQVAAYESEPAAIAALDRAARDADLPATATTRDLDRMPLTATELDRFDMVVLDPPRAGAGAQSRALARSGVSTIAYVSCHPESFARDARILVDGGYRLTRITAVDQFLWTPHVELVAGFSRD